MNPGPLHIAVIGAGIAGLAAVHRLQRVHRVTLFEKEARLGGHTNTVTIPDGPDAGTPVDTGFIVMNHRNYPLLTALFEELDVTLRNAEMSFGYHDAGSGLQYSGTDLNSLFAQRANLVRPSFWGMVRDVFRFFSVAERDVRLQTIPDETLAGYLARHRFGKAFIEHHLIPMGSAIWSTPCEQMLQFPARSFLQFFNNHGLLTLNNRPQWKTVVGGSKEYIRRMRAGWKQVTIRMESGIAGVRRDRGAHIRFQDGHEESFDAVLIAVHADEALSLLLDPSPDEQALLGPWRYARSRTFLHTDESVMPPLRRVWSAWNFKRLDGARTCLTYDMNRLQGLDTQQRYFVSLDLPEEPRGIVGEFLYTHPMFTREALAARDRLAALNGARHTWFAGSYFGNGFHEDGARSGIEAAHALMHAQDHAEPSPS